MTDEQLLEDYSREIFQSYYSPSDKLTLASLIESHRSLRDQNKERLDVHLQAQKEGYDYGLSLAFKNVAADTIHYDDLRKMTVQELANLIGADY